MVDPAFAEVPGCNRRSDQRHPFLTELLAILPEPEDPDTLRLHLDYVIPGYRDLKIGRYLYTPKTGVCEGFERAVSPAGGNFEKLLAEPHNREELFPKK